MSQIFQPEQPKTIVSFLLRIVAFGVFFVFLYLSFLFVITNSSDKVKNAFGRLTNIYPYYYVRYAYPGGDAFLRYQEISNFKNVDIVFIGSSHSYRTFDPRIFHNHKISSFNMGSRAQTPLNSFYLLKRYIEDLRPKLIIFEVYPEMFGKDGLESFLELSRNLKMERMLLSMAFNIKNIRAWHAVLVQFLDLDRKKIEDLSSAIPPYDQYISGGYVETHRDHVGNWKVAPHKIHINKRQLAYLEEIVSLAHAKGSDIVFVTQPLPESTVKCIQNFAEVNEKIRAIAEKYKVTFLEFNNKNYLNEEKHFFDYHHLNQDAVEVFNKKIIEDLTQLNLLERIMQPGDASRARIVRTKNKDGYDAPN